MLLTTPGWGSRQLQPSSTLIPLQVQVHANLLDYQMCLVPSPSPTRILSFSRGGGRTHRVDAGHDLSGLPADGTPQVLRQILGSPLPEPRIQAKLPIPSVCVRGRRLVQSCPEAGQPGAGAGASYSGAGPPFPVTERNYPLRMTDCKVSALSLVTRQPSQHGYL